MILVLFLEVQVCEHEGSVPPQTYGTVNTNRQHLTQPMFFIQLLFTVPQSIVLAFRLHGGGFSL